MEGSMSFTVARYNGKMGYLIAIANSPSLVGFMTNTTYHKVQYHMLESGKYILPVPFYRNHEVQIQKVYVNASYKVKLISNTGNIKQKELRVASGDIRWFLIDTSKWGYDLRHNAVLRYGIPNLNLIEYERNI